MAHETASQDGTELQLRCAADELERRLRAGPPCRAEDLLAAFPELADDPRLAFALVIREFVLRGQLGQRPDPEEWYARFPQWTDQLREQFQSPDLALTDPAGEPSTVAEAAGPPPLSGTAPVNGAGRQFGRYRVSRELGWGGMGVVYEADDPLLGRRVAVKAIRGNRAAAEQVARFLREARAEGRLDHPHIVKVMDIGWQDGDPFFVMECYAGGSLARRMGEFRGDARRGVALVEKVARAVHHMHERDVIHRDLKPSNILLDEHGEPKVSDFGLARLLDEDAELTRTGQSLGTPAYMAPEQAHGHAACADARTDVWSLGVILYELLTGYRPFAGRSSEEVTRLVRSADPTPPRALAPGLGRDLETIILTCLEKDPARRYASAGKLADDLARWQRGEPIEARPPGRLRRAARRVRRHPLWAIAGCLLIIGLAAAATAPLVRAPTDPERAVKRAEARLAAGHKVELIGDAGLPAWHRPRAAGGKFEAAPPEGWLQLKAPDLCLVELLRDPQTDRYRLSADVWHESGGVDGVGLYFLHGEQDTAAGPEQYFATLTFSEVGPAAGRAVVYFRRSRDPDRFDSSRGPQLNFKPATPRWRHLEVRVTPESVKAWWDGKAVGEVSRADLTRYGVNLLGDDPPAGAVPPAFTPRGGLGLFARAGEAFFRRVVVEPLP